MNDKEKIKELKEIFDEVIWMAIRYAHGRHTYSSGVVREACERRAAFGDFCLSKDIVIERAEKYEDLREDRLGATLKTDYLNDLFEIYSGKKTIVKIKNFKEENNE